MTLPPRHIVIACDKFKGSLTADEACAAIGRGLHRRWPHATIRECPIADGGEGFTLAMQRALGGQWVTTPTHDALGRPITARYLVAPTADGPVAVMEMAEASGIWRIAPADRDPLRSSTFGTGEMIRHAVEHSRVSRVIIGLGGSGTNDGGAGMAAALGVAFLDANHQPLDPCPATLAAHLKQIDCQARIPLPPVAAACDVDTPLLGPNGATRVFGPQKGATPETIPILEAALATIARLSNPPDATQPATGAAGGLAFGLRQFANAQLLPGFDLLASTSGLAAEIAAADLVVTGEGTLDSQSLAGKCTVGVAQLARHHHTPVWAFCGHLDPATNTSDLFHQITTLTSTKLPQTTLLTRAADLLESLAASLPLTFPHEDHQH